MFGDMVVNSGVSPSYFWDEMTFKEIEYIQNAQNNKYKDEWEKVRMSCYYQMFPHLTKSAVKKPINKIIEMPWDKDNKNLTGDDNIYTDKKKMETKINKMLARSKKKS